MRRAVRAIIIRDGNLVVMHRNKFGTKYATLPGGNIEMGETPEQALYREVGEETMMTFTDPRLVFIEHAGDPFGDQLIYLCRYQSGEPKLHPQSEEEHINKLGKNLYEPGWLPFADLVKAPFRSEQLKENILKYADGNWPEKAIEFSWI